MKEKIVQFFKVLSRMPYKWCWIAMMLCTMVLFSWWDEIAIWGLGAAWDWRIVPIYYIVEYGVMIPLVLYLGKKTYAKLNLDIALWQLLIQSLKNSLPVLLYRKIKEKVRSEQKKWDGKDLFPCDPLCPSCKEMYLRITDTGDTYLCMSPSCRFVMDIEEFVQKYKGSILVRR